MKCSNVVLYNRNVVSVFVYTLSASLHFAIPTSVRFLLEIFHVNFGEYFDANKLQHAGVVAWYMHMKLIIGFPGTCTKHTISPH